MDGWVIIGTKLDTKQFERDLKDLNKELEQEQKEAEELTEKKLNFEYSKDKAIKNLEKINAQLDKAKQKYESMQKTGFRNLLPEQLDKIGELEKEAQNYQFIINNSEQGLKKVNGEIKENVKNQEVLNGKISETVSKIDQVKKASDVNESLGKVGKSITAITKKVGKWALAVFGVRSAYMFVRQAMSTLSQYDKQLATDIEFIRYAVATTLEPIIKALVKLAYQLLTALNIIWQKMFKTSLFSKDLAKNFKNAKNSASAMKKTLAGFDELNILNKGGSTGIDLSPSFDPSKSNTEIENWINKTIAKLQGFARIVTETFNGIFPNLNFGLIGTTLVNEFRAAWDMVSGVFTNNYDKINKGIGEFVNNLGNKIKLLPTIFDISQLFQNGGNITFGLENIGRYLGEQLGKKLRESLEQYFTPGWGTRLAKNFANAIIDVFNSLISKINDKLYLLRNAIVVLGKVLGKSWSLDSVKIPSIPRLAKGGIVNMPGKGVPIGGALAGEKAPEAVLPLSDDAVLNRIADAIGKRITINADITLELESRILARVMKEINNNNAFARNGV